jgi:ADP-ribosylglycohydrolase
MANVTKIDLDQDYAERVYAGVLGKIIGVYLGRPFEQWSNNRIEKELGEIDYYVHDRLGQPLIVTDDDISGTFTFLRALAENGYDPNLTSAQIGDWWLNTLIENRTILWWGGLGLSTEHTAYLRLKAGHKAPASGSIALNGVAVAEEIGAQIFVDGWGLICPADPERAADFARRAASVSHDGEAIFGAQIVAAMISLAFAESDIRTMLATARTLIPSSSVISALIGDMLEWSAGNGDDWRATLKLIHEVYPYARFGTNCPMVSNHAIVLLGLLHGNADFSRSLMIANTAGYDTDCNSGNVGCILGVLTGLNGIDAGPDWRGPVADRMYLPTADGGRAITDAVRETYEIVNTARGLARLPRVRPKDDARFHFSLPGSVQGFRIVRDGDDGAVVNIGNEDGKLAIGIANLAPGAAVRAGTSTFTQPDALDTAGYALLASPTLYSGQTVSARLIGSTDLSSPIKVAIYTNVYGAEDELAVSHGPFQRLNPGDPAGLSWTVPDTGGAPIAEVGIVIVAAEAASRLVRGCVLLDWLTWDGCPDVTLRKPTNFGRAWQKAWVNGADEFGVPWFDWGLTYRIIQNVGTGLVTQGTASWSNYEVSCVVRPHMVRRVGLAAAVRGLRRYIALMLDADKRVRLVRQNDAAHDVLAESAVMWQFEETVNLSLRIDGNQVIAMCNDTELIAPKQHGSLSGAVGLLVDEGHAEFGDVRVHAASRTGRTVS